MSLRASISHHLDLHHYWLSKRAGRAMPARSDLNPDDIPALQPYLGIADHVIGQFRYRLFGIAAAQQLGYDLSGNFVGSYVSTPESAAALRAIYERVFATAHPVFATGEYKTKWGAILDISQLILPLSDDGTNVNMVVFTRIARFNFDVTTSIGLLKGAPIKVCDVVDVGAAADIEKRCLDWERHCFAKQVSFA
jgi:hypothetical protein